MAMRIGMAMVAALAGLAACAAPVQWEKPGVSGAEARKDTAQCRSFASSEAERRYGRDNPREDFGTDGPADRFQGTMARNDAVLFQNRVFNECMASQGYRKAGSAKP